jgi:hypothetical protein
MTLQLIHPAFPVVVYQKNLIFFFISVEERAWMVETAWMEGGD